MSVLTGIDILGIQNYIFASNRLRDVYAASWMVECVTGMETLWEVPDATKPQNVLQAAGGNAILEFDGLNAAQDWTTAYTRWLWNAAPGLSAVVAHRSRNGKSLAWGIMALRMDLARAKLERIPDAPQLGLGVTAPCAITGLPAVGAEHGDLLSPQILQLRGSRKAAGEQWDQFLPKNLPNAPDQTFAFPEELDHMGRSHGTVSRVGIVHVDGNRIGGAIRQWLEEHMKNKTGDEAVRREMGEWSNGLRNLAEGVLHALCGRVAQAIHAENGRAFLRGAPSDKGFPLEADKDRGGEGKAYFLPLRPILLGGDDLTFVCDGRIALDLAAAAIREFEKTPIPHLGENGGEKTVTACAGVALVKAHAPFHRGYKLSEDLCKSAKQGRLKTLEENKKEENKEPEPDGGWMDWHLGGIRPGETVESLRKRQYQFNTHELTRRPYRVTPCGDKKPDWDWLESELLGPGKEAESWERGFRGDGSWRQSRNRVKKLVSLVPYGPDRVKRQMSAWKATAPNLKMPAGLDDGGFAANRTSLLDAIELLDDHLRLEPDPARSDNSNAKEAAS
jgi:hypothetical protein